MAYPLIQYSLIWDETKTKLRSCRAKNAEQMLMLSYINRDVLTLRGLIHKLSQLETQVTGVYQ